MLAWLLDCPALSVFSRPTRCGSTPNWGEWRSENQIVDPGYSMLQHVIIHQAVQIGVFAEFHVLPHDFVREWLEETLHMWNVREEHNANASPTLFGAIPTGNVYNIAIEHSHRNSWFSHQTWISHGDFPSFLASLPLKGPPNGRARLGGIWCQFLVTMMDSSPPPWRPCCLGPRCCSLTEKLIAGSIEISSGND